MKVNSAPGETKIYTTPTAVRGVEIYHFPWVKDPRGDLTVGQFESEFFMFSCYIVINNLLTQWQDEF